ncbi:hypothetical protein [Embleya scabrispora]|uniref:hypothetical protein n=1 Tax=Embleya scabrispora TaxID=159449 RepID=UPI00036ED510|nr:hypothetical protein [Embleya scabrispora]MYS80142.1 hypothetical protein [Streptomyces sp. SID5474]
MGVVGRKAEELRDEVVGHLRCRRRIRQWIAIGFVFGLLIGAGLAAGAAALYWPEKDKPLKMTMREWEIPVKAPAVLSGPATFTAQGLTCGIEWITGTHAEHFAKGRLCRVKVSIANNSLATVQIANLEQRLVLSDGSRLGMDLESMEIKRQLRDFTLGASDTLVEDLWFDLPKDIVPTAILLRANADTPQGRAELPRRDWSKK